MVHLSIAFHHGLRLGWMISSSLDDTRDPAGTPCAGPKPPAGIASRLPSSSVRSH